jgi:hypothetical protein
LPLILPIPNRGKRNATQAEPDPRLVFIKNDKGELILSYEAELPATPQNDDRVLILDQVLERYRIPAGENLPEIDGTRLERGMYFLNFR